MFNLFKKKSKRGSISSTPENVESPYSILCIPGKWKDTTEIVQAIAQYNRSEYLFAGKILMDINTQQGFEMEIFERDVRMKHSFEYAGKVNEVSQAFLEIIDQHSHVIYLKTKTGNFQDARALAEAGRAILKAGGMGVKVETTGKAFEKDQWMTLLEDPEYTALYPLYVLTGISDGDGNIYSCGMHNLGLKDTMVSLKNVQEAVETITIFSYYQIMEHPSLEALQTFSTDTDAPRFIIREETDQPNKGDEWFENPYGMWALEKEV